MPDAFFEHARDNFKQYKKDKLYQKTERAAFYIYQIETDKRSYTGLIALNPLEEYFAGRIKAHEDTLYEKEKQQISLFEDWQAVLKPVLLAYPAVSAIEDRLKAHAGDQKPWIELGIKAETHRIWPISGAENIREFQQLFASLVPCGYIADGHHRVTGMARMFEQQESRYVQLDCTCLYSAFFADNQLEIHDYNRIVRSERLRDESAFFGVLKTVFEIKKNQAPCKPARKGELGLYFHGKWYLLGWKTAWLSQYEANDPVPDTELFNRLVLKKLFGIEDVRGDRNVLYIEGPKGAEGLKTMADRNIPCAGFMLYPLTFEALQHLVDAGKHLPPKSTWFEPRLKSGLLVNSLERV